MTATVTASISSLILTLSDPGRDDLAHVIVWGSATSGFTPAAGNIVFLGKALTITIANLTPLTPFYLRYAYVSTIDPSDYVISAEISGTPNKIAGGLIADGALRGKSLAGAAYMDAGTTVTAFVAKPTDVVTLTTVSVIDTTDFASSGSAYVQSGVGGKTYSFRYTGKTATSFTGVSGVYAEFFVGDVVSPIPYGFLSVDNFAGGGSLFYGSEFIFPQSGGNGLCFGSGASAQSFTYTAGQYMLGIYKAGLFGLSGLSSWTTPGIPRYVIHNPGFNTSALTTGTKTSITTQTNSAFLNAGGGRAFLVCPGVSGYIDFNYSAYNATTGVMTVAANWSVIIATAGTYSIVPWFSRVVLGQNNSVFAFSINGVVTFSPESMSAANASFSAIGSNSAGTFSAQNSPAGWFLNSNYYLQIWATPSAGVASGLSAGAAGHFGFTTVAGAAWPTYHDGSGYKYLQPMGSSVRFSGPEAADIDDISFDDSTNTYHANADGTADAGNFVVNNLRVNGRFAATTTRSTVASGSTITATNTDTAILYDQAATVAALTVALPSGPSDGQELTFATRSAITTLTISGTAYGKPTTLAAGGFCKFAYQGTAAAWFRVG